jgi:hypothetical protein
MIGKWHFAFRKRRYVHVWSVRHLIQPVRSSSMIRRRLLLAATVVASFVLAACSDMTAPKNDSCPVTNGGSTLCKGN